MKQFIHKTKYIGTMVFNIEDEGLSSLYILDLKNSRDRNSFIDIPDNFKPLLNIIESYLAGEVFKFKDVQKFLNIQGGTEFQRLVWNEIAKIPHGETKSYKEIANAINRPKAVRAVGSACGANKYAILIPCHRVLSSSGAITGYRWGNNVKAMLLELEGA